MEPVEKGHGRVLSGQATPPATPEAQHSMAQLGKVLHQHSYDHVDQHKLGRQHEGHKVDRGDDSVVAGGLLVTVPEGVLWEV